MANGTFILDDIDKKIVEFIQRDPTSTHTQIAKKINRSQPTVGMRIKKLEEAGILQYQAGLNLKNMNFYFAKIELQTCNPELIFDIFQSCPYMIHGYRVSGSSNFVIIIGNFTLKDIDNTINFHFRNNPEVKNVKAEIITNIINEFVIPIDLKIGSCNCFKDK
ncbi:MAG: Lrp/AsnC family transcriptional regulator [Promethearchaeota archaeon]